MAYFFRLFSCTSYRYKHSPYETSINNDFQDIKRCHYRGIVRMCGIHSFKVLLIQLLYLIQSHLDYIKLAICLAFTLERLPDAKFVYRQFICQHSLNNRLACWGLSLVRNLERGTMHSKRQLLVQRCKNVLSTLCPVHYYTNYVLLLISVISVKTLQWFHKAA